MDKKLFKLQVRHNYFVRYVVVSICKLMLITFAFFLLLIITQAIAGNGVVWAAENTYKPTAYTEKILAITYIVDIIFAMVYLFIVIIAIIKIVSLHKAVSIEEEKIYGDVSKRELKKDSSALKNVGDSEEDL